MRSIKTVSTATVLTLFLFGCSSSGGFNLISLQEEWQLGDQLAADVAKQVQLVPDPAANAYVTDLGQRIVNQTPMKDLPWHFHIVNDPAVNAFSIPGGHVYVNTGLIAAANSASELAGVMAHEISHGVARHATQQLSKQYGLSVLAGIVLGQNPAVYEQILAQVIGGGAMARFSRADEKEADDMGVKFMYAAGYDPRGMVTMFEELKRREQGNPGSVERFFMSHPLTEDRIADVKKQVAKLPAKAGLITDTPQYQEMRRSLTGR